MSEWMPKHRVFLQRLGNAGLILLLVMNVLVLLRTGITRSTLSEPPNRTEETRLGALALADYYDRQADRLGLSDNPAVREALARLRYEIDQAVTPEAIVTAMTQEGRNVEGTLAREEEAAREQHLLQLINQDPRIALRREPARLLIGTRVDADGQTRVVVEDPDGVLSPETRDALYKDPTVAQLTRLVEIQVAEGKTQLLATRTLSAQIESLRSDVERLRTELQSVMRSSGYAELSGPGVLIRVQAASRNGQPQPILATDIRDMVNELFAAGAAGVEVGGQRLVATSSIRSVGDQILVNQQPIVTRPLVIKAVGDPNVLISSLDLLRNSPYYPYTIDIARYSVVTLTARQAPGL
ncbi:MAG: DUF881 domain-containing protein [Limnochordaceae bacterium]|nr:DUF881 domain-containing protein [Limnochordaceae bacterium]